jgi:hypothetical protein
MVAAGMTLLVGFDSAWTAGNSGEIAGLLQESGGPCREIDLTQLVNYRRARELRHAIEVISEMVYYDLSTTALCSGSVTICINRGIMPRTNRDGTE